MGSFVHQTGVRHLGEIQQQSPHNCGLRFEFLADLLNVIDSRRRLQGESMRKAKGIPAEGGGITDPTTRPKTLKSPRPAGVADFCWNRWPDNFGMGGRFKLESVAELSGMRIILGYARFHR